MKRAAFCFLLIVNASAAFCEFRFSAGVESSLTFDSFSFRFQPVSNTYTETAEWTSFLGFGIFGDATYAFLGVEYAMALGRTHRITLVSSGVTVTDDEYELPVGFSMNVLGITIFGKFPFDFGAFSIWPACGIKYSVVINLDIDEDDVGEYLSPLDLNDFFIIGGNWGGLFIH
jgi:hypothetical protein